MELKITPATANSTAWPLQIAAEHFQGKKSAHFKITIKMVLVFISTLLATVKSATTSFLEPLHGDCA
jgi:hypothetical protein